MAVSARELTLILRVQSAGASNIRRMANDLNQLERSGMTFNQRFQKASQSIGAVGRQMQLIGGIGTAALGLAANSAANLQSQVTLAATQVANNVGRVKQVASRDFQGILDQMTKFPTSADDMSKALYDIYSTLNVTARQGIPLLEQLNKAAVAGGLTAQDAGSGLLSIMSNFKEIPQTVGGARTAFNRMFAAVRFGRVTMQQFSTSLATTAPAAKIAGQTLNSMAGTVAFLSRALGPAKASVGYARLVEVLSGQQMQDGLKKVGVNIDGANGKMLQLDKVIQILVRRFPYLAQGGIKALNFFKTIGNLQSTIQARRAFATLVHDVGGYQNILHKTVSDNNEFNKSYKAMSQSLGIQWQVLLNNLKSIALTVGLAVIPAFIQMSKPLLQAVHWFQNLDPAVQSTISRFAAFAAVGALVGGTFLTIAAGIGVAISTLAELGGAVSLIAVGFGTYTVFAGIALKIYENWDKLGGLFKAVAGDIKDFAAAVGRALKDFQTGNWSDLWKQLGLSVSSGAQLLKDGLNLMLESLVTWGKEFISSAQGIIEAFGALMFAGLAGKSGIAKKSIAAATMQDFLTPFIAPIAGPAGIGLTAAKKAGDIQTARDLAAQQLALGVQGGTAKSEDIARAAARRELSATDAAALTAALAARQRSELNVMQRFAVGAKPAMQRAMTNIRSGWFQYQGTKDLLKAHQADRAVLNPFVTALGGLGGPTSVTKGMSSVEANARLAARGFNTIGVAAKNAAVGGIKVAGSAMSTFGKSILSFGGMVNPWVGGIALAAGGFYLLSSALKTSKTSLQLATDGIHRAQSGYTNLATSMKTARDAQIQISGSRLTLGQQNQQINKLQDAVSKAAVGTNAYRNAEQSLNAAQLQRQSTLANLTTAQDALNKSLDLSVANAEKGSRGLSQYLNNIGSARSTLSVARQEAFHPTSPASPAMARAIRTPQDYFREQSAGVDKLSASAHTAINRMNAAAIAVNQFAAAGGNLSRGTAATVVDRIAIGMSKMLIGTDKAATGIVGLARQLNKIPKQQEVQFFSNLPHEVIPGVQVFMHMLHALPSQKVVRFLDNHTTAQRSLAALTAALGHLPSKKQIRFLTDHHQYDLGIAHYIEKYHRLPDAKHLKLIVDAADAEKQLEKARQHLARLQQQSDRAIHLGGIQGAREAPSLKVNTGPLDRNIAAAKQKVQNLDKIVGQSHTKKYDIVFHPTANAAISQANTLGGKLGDGIIAGLHSREQAAAAAGAAVAAAAIAGASAKAKPGSPSRTMMKAVGIPLAQGIYVPMHEHTGHAAKAGAGLVDALILGAKGAAEISSPSKRAKRQVGDPILQGILAGLKKPADIKSAADSVMQNMVSAFQTNKDTFQQQLGTLFAGATSQAAQNFPDALQQKLQWGEPVKLGDLRGDLHSQIQTFQRAQHDISRIVRRGGRHTNMAFIDALRQQGPAAQPEITALLHATPRQLRQYEQMWQRSQKLIANQAKTATKGQFQAYMQQGKSVALGFLQGLQSEAPGLERYFRGMFTRLLHTVKHVHKSHSPSLVYMQEGMNVAKGFQLGVQHGMHPLTMHPRIAPVGGGWHGRMLVPSVTNNYYNRTYNVYPQKEENLLTALRKHDHITRHRP